MSMILNGSFLGFIILQDVNQLIGRMADVRLVLLNSCQYVLDLPLMVLFLCLTLFI